MFNLEKAIAAWRRSFRYHRAFFDDDVEELERHLRDGVAARVAQGWPEEAAFEAARSEVGAFSSLEAEYGKVFWAKLRHRRGLFDTLMGELTMLKNYLKIAFRTLLRYKGYTAINVTGLAIGIACCLLILLYVRDEVSYDRHHDAADRIVRVQLSVPEREIIVTPTIVAPTFRREFPEVEAATRLYDIGAFTQMLVRRGDRVFQESRFFYADSTVFDVFTLPFIAGDPETALVRPETVVLTRSIAQKYFGDENPVGHTLLIGSDSEFEVTGVIEDLPRTSHIQFDFLGSFVTTSWAEQEIWSSANFLTYLKLENAAALETLPAKVDAFLDRVRAENPQAFPPEFRLRLISLTDIRLHFEGRIQYVYLFSALALLILFIACINYMNLATARAARRAREVGVRKVVGANRKQLVRQFYGESALLVLVAVVLSVGLAWLLLPFFNAISGKALTLNLAADPLIGPALLGVLVVVSAVAGSYPALLLSSFRPAHVLKGTFQASKGGALFRRGLVVFQFAVSIFLIAATAVVYDQLDYARSKPLGFDKEQVVVLPLSNQQLRDAAETMKEAFLQHPNVRQAAAINSLPGQHRGGYGLIAEGLDLAEGETFPILGVPADRDVVETLGLELVAGQGFPQSPSYEPDSGRFVYLVNEATLQKTGWSVEEALGRKVALSSPNRMGEIVGVVQDYHQASLREAIQPMALFLYPSYWHLLVKIAPADVPSTMAFLRETWSRLAPELPFEYTFLDQEYYALYQADEQMAEVYGTFAGLAIVIACLGLLGLASFAAEQRTKEIGVRKVLGASVPQIVLLLSKEFTHLVLIGFVIAVPVAYFLMNHWLSAFAYRVDISWWIFLVAGLAALAIAWLTVSYQSLKAAFVNPAKSLRYE